MESNHKIQYYDEYDPSEAALKEAYSEREEKRSKREERRNNTMKNQIKREKHGRWK